ncbi:transglutaminase domain-containing protein [Paenibacillus sp. NPDC058071]|uniref:transglutaminase domain-containing protein n=1 Tax=Paenibacillus sp. NPDC058071 TaxID=3346326 RepID=UPI0036D9766A
MTNGLGWDSTLEPIAIVVLLLLLGSLLQGMRRGASGSAKRLFFFLWDAVSLVVCLLVAWKAAGALSSPAAEWLTRAVQVPEGALSGWQNYWYTLVTGLRDFSLLRFAVLFLLTYVLLRLIVSALLTPLAGLLLAGTGRQRSEGRHAASVIPGSRAASRAAGAALGAVHGAGRAFVFIAVLFVYVSLVPNGWLVGDIKKSPLYNEAAAVLEPVAGDILAGQGPVLAEAVQAEFRKVLQRKYELIDANIPDDIGQAALEVTKGKSDEEAKARALYDWLGTRIAYDWDKANNYVEQGVWKEQTPSDTFRTRIGVCIDTARLYAVMARAAGLDVRVVTGLGADGRGGYGPHAWNEVRVGGENGFWIPLDATWASSGDWFNPPGFDKTHIREA